MENEEKIIKKDSIFIKFFQWIKTCLEDHQGKISIKRVIALMLAITICYVIIHIARNNDLSKFSWDSTNLFLTVVFGQISLLITAVIIEKKHILNSKDVNSTSVTKSSDVTS